MSAPASAARLGAALRVGGEGQAAGHEPVVKDRVFRPCLEVQVLLAERVAGGRQLGDEGARVVEGGQHGRGREAQAGERERVLDEAGAGPTEGQEEGELLEDGGQRALEVGVSGGVPQVGEGVRTGEGRLEEGRQVAETLLDLRAQGGQAAPGPGLALGFEPALGGRSGMCVRVRDRSSPRENPAKRALQGRARGVNCRTREEAVRTRFYRGFPGPSAPIFREIGARTNAQGLRTGDRGAPDDMAERTDANAPSVGPASRHR
ncbi:hypothetical protein [Nannocystis pusilla]|uniref:hypothetical protein n=1 Tax=Nannocystis pusilla TaxID=889268 RepID=UPI003B75E955